MSGPSKPKNVGEGENIMKLLEIAGAYERPQASFPKNDSGSESSFDPAEFNGKYHSDIHSVNRFRQSVARFCAVSSDALPARGGDAAQRIMEMIENGASKQEICAATYQLCLRNGEFKNLGGK